MRLETLEIYVYYDEPVLFSCKNSAGEKFLAVALEEGWGYIPISEEALTDIKSGNVDLLSAIVEDWETKLVPQLF